MSFGPPRDGRATFQRLDRNPAGRAWRTSTKRAMRAIEVYFGSYGTGDARACAVLARRGARRRRKAAPVVDRGVRRAVATVEVEGKPARILRGGPRRPGRGDAGDGRAPPASVRPMGHRPGTADAYVVPPDRRATGHSRGDIVIAGGVVSGSWSVKGEMVTLTWFSRPDRARARRAGRGGRAPRGRSSIAPPGGAPARRLIGTRPAPSAAGDGPGGYTPGAA